MLYLFSYAGALRCIGQELQERNIELFELECHAGGFRAQCGDPNPPYTKLIELVFSNESIQRIDREGRAQRGRARGEIRFDGIPEVLRAAGDYVDKKAGRLRYISNGDASSDGALLVKFQSRTGDIESKSLTASFLRETCVEMHKRRSDLQHPVSSLTRKR